MKKLLPLWNQVVKYWFLEKSGSSTQGGSAMPTGSIHSFVPIHLASSLYPDLINLGSSLLRCKRTECTKQKQVRCTWTVYTWWLGSDLFLLPSLQHLSLCRAKKTPACWFALYFPPLPKRCVHTRWRQAEPVSVYSHHPPCPGGQPTLPICVFPGSLPTQCPPVLHADTPLSSSCIRVPVCGGGG